MKLVPINSLFDIRYGNSLELINLEQCAKSHPLAINYVSRTEKNNGISAFVERNDEFTENPVNTISVAVSGSVLSSFLQPEPYYTGFHIFVLSPKKPMSQLKLLFYCECIRANKYKYNYGRQDNRTLKDILVPTSLPVEFQKINVEQVVRPVSAPLSNKIIGLDETEWGKFKIGDLFDVKKGKRLTKEDMNKGDTPFIGAIDSNNGYRDYIDLPPIHTGNTITVNYNGSVVESFYQPLPFWASDDVNVLYPKFKMSIYIALFISTIIEKEKYRFNYGRKWHKDRMDKSAINLPAKNGKLDFIFMENYMKSLPYSRNLTATNLVIAELPKSIKKPKIEKGLSDDELVAK